MANNLYNNQVTPKGYKDGGKIKNKKSGAVIDSESTTSTALVKN